ncbi:protein kinase domain-containing protein [Candidatus Uabimicrobium amorphum]|uniref:non-specific serine/threonine protein kinase n=1 Tax=Uabimicrobium amorphum TaxID=2596890 RepID=A0A5S9IIX9_UABAM|nr:protein kinase [Candidatus Uabimicrobium amorphum]BBM82729.1 protein kinase [Candidatus Uabimicrobium amorphum]
MNKTEGANILVVDDNEMNRDMLSRRLKRKKFSVLTAASGLEALDLVSKHEFNLILLDINMPGMNGIEALQEIRKKYSMSELPVIMVSARYQSEDIAWALENGANDYITKPVDFVIALARIKTQLSYAKVKDNVEECVTMDGLQTSDGIKIGEDFFHYRIEDKLGQGGMGIVYKAYDTRLERYVALKSIRDTNERLIKRLTQEARAIAQIKHPNIITVYDIGNTPLHYFVMEYIEGKTLDHFIKSGEVTPGIAVGIAQKIANALFTAHKSGVVHRDLKPANIIIDNDGEPHIMDFGLAKVAENEKLTKDNEIVGTPCYMAPEQIDVKRGKIDVQTDIYAAGAILYEMITGKPPFEIKGTKIHEVLWKVLQDEPVKPSDLQKDIPQELDDICLKALEKEQEKRFSNAHEMEQAIAKVYYQHFC